ncbi:hypothetical protein D3C73_18080 [compost metagenome]
MFVSLDSFVTYPFRIKEISFYPSPMTGELDLTDPDFGFVFTREISINMKNPTIYCERDIDIDIDSGDAVGEELIEEMERLLPVRPWSSLFRLDPSGEESGQIGFAYDRTDESVTFDQVKEYALQIFEALVAMEIPLHVREGWDNREHKQEQVEKINRNRAMNPNLPIQDL